MINNGTMIDRGMWSHAVAPPHSDMAIRAISEEEGLPLRDIGLAPAPSKPPPAFSYAVELFHLGLFANEALVSVGTFILEDLPSADTSTYSVKQNHWRLRGMATLPDHRGKGYASAVLDCGIWEVVFRQGRLLWFNGRSTAAQFYRARGFRQIGHERIIPGLQPHFRFSMDLSDKLLAMEERER